MLARTACTSQSCFCKDIHWPSTSALHSVLPREGRHIHFLETLHELAARVAGSELPQELDMMINDKMVSKLPKVHAPSSSPGRSVGFLLLFACIHGRMAP